MSMMNCDFCDNRKDTDFVELHSVKEGDYSRCEGCAVDQVADIQTVLSAELLSRISNTTEAEQADGTAEYRMADAVEKVEANFYWTEKLTFIDVETLIEESA